MNSSKFNQGFTLIEIMVSLAIFSVVAVVAAGSLIRVVTANGQTRYIQAAVNNVNFIMESMSRELRVGNTYYCDVSPTWTYSGSGLSMQACSISDPGSVIAFKSTKTALDSLGRPCRLIYAYRFVPSGSEFDIEKAEQTACNQALSNDDFEPFLSDNVHITDYRLFVYSADPNNVYPIIVVRLKGYAGDRLQERAEFNVETAISQRISQSS